MGHVHTTLELHVLGTLDAGIGETHLNTILTTLNIPPMSRSTFKKREREVGLAVEHVAKKAVQIL